MLNAIRLLTWARLVSLAQKSQAVSFSKNDNSYLDSSGSIQICNYTSFISIGSSWHNDPLKEWLLNGKEIELEYHGTWRIIEQEEEWFKMTSSLDQHKFVYTVIAE